MSGFFISLYNGFMLHPSIKILSVVMLAIAVNLAGYPMLLLIACMLAVFLVRYKARIFWKMLRRVRWILASLVLIYAFSTPGEYVALGNWLSEPWILAPTYEGLSTGAMQFARLCIMLAGLSLLLATSSREDLIVGFYLLLRPLSRMGLSAERFAARLWLTLDYVEQSSLQRDGRNLLERLASGMAAPPVSATQHIELVAPRLGWRDFAWLAGLVIAGAIVPCV